MSLFKRINVIRGNIMHKLTHRVGQSDMPNPLADGETLDVKRILISRPNHRLGNQLLITPLIQELIALFPGCTIDLFVKGGLGPILYENYKEIDRIITLPRKPFKQLLPYIGTWFKIKKQRYDLVINADKNSSSGRLSTKFARAKYKIFGDVDDYVKNQYLDHDHIAKYPIYGLRQYLDVLGIKDKKKTVPTLNIKLSSDELLKGKARLDALVSSDKPTLCVFTFATGDKCYKEDWWIPVYERLKVEFDNYNILEVLPVENVSQINFKAPAYYSKDIREICALMANTSGFFGADSGMMHLASAAQVPVVGLFSVTKISIYEPYGNGSVAIDTTKGTIDDWMPSIKKAIL